jgi:hypothetical protein
MVALFYRGDKLNKSEEVVSRVLNYSFNDIEWDYEKLTSVEKELMTEKEFNDLRKKYRK